MTRPTTVPEPITLDDEIAVLKLRIGESGLSARRFAVEVLHRDERTVRRWISGDVDIPNCVLDWLIEPSPHPWPPKKRGAR